MYAKKSPPWNFLPNSENSWIYHSHILYYYYTSCLNCFLFFLLWSGKRENKIFFWGDFLWVHSKHLLTCFQFFMVFYTFLTKPIILSTDLPSFIFWQPMKARWYRPHHHDFDMKSSENDFPVELVGALWLRSIGQNVT